jgi:glycosyltransferase involved in cell wall biosynthesis
MSTVPSSIPGPLISVIVPSFNQGRFIRETLLSILGQDYRPLEVLVMDGASKDDTVAILTELAARHPELRWRSEPDKGPADAVNKGLAEARGEYAIIQSSDDLHYPGAISAAAAVLRSDPSCNMVYGDCDRIDEAGERSASSSYPEFSWEAFFANACCWPQGSVLFPVALARQIGGWRGEFYGCDVDFWLRMAFRARMRKVNHVMYGWRCYEGQRTRPDLHARICRDYNRMIAESEDLRRAPARLRRLARASCHIMAVKFNPTGSDWSRRRHLFQAILMFPGHLRYASPQDSRVLLVPFYMSLRGAWRRLRPARHGAGAKLRSA